MGKAVATMFALMLLCTISHAEQPPYIPTPPGATLISEINLSDSDILGMVKQGITAFAQEAAGSPGELGTIITNLDLNTLMESISGVKQVRAAQYALPKGTDTVSVLEFYNNQLTAADGWTRIIYSAEPAPKKPGAVFIRPGQDTVCVGVDPTINRLSVARVVGSVDIPKFSAWAGRTIKFFAAMDAQKKAQAATRPCK